MLRAGATVIATTRFPVDSALRFAKEEDFDQVGGDRLKIHGLDLRHSPSVEIFLQFYRAAIRSLGCIDQQCSADGKAASRILCALDAE